jgi:hypothetical protein
MGGRARWEVPLRVCAAPSHGRSSCRHPRVSALRVRAKGHGERRPDAVALPGSVVHSTSHPLARTEVPGWVEPSVKPFRTTSPLPRGGGTGDFFILASIVGFAAAAAAAAPVPDPDAGGAPPAKKQRRSKLEVARTKHEAAIVKLAELQQKASATRHAANKTRLGPKKDELSLKADTAEQQVAAQKQLADALAAEVDGRS